MKTSEQLGTHYTSSVFIISNNKVLLLKHKKMNSWLAPGGHVEPDELPHETALRETKEETGLVIELIDTDKEFGKDKKFLEENDSEVKIFPMPWKTILEKISENHYHIDLLYLAKTKNTKIINNENHELKWFTQKDLEQEEQIFPNAKYFAIKAIEKFKQANTNKYDFSKPIHYCAGVFVIHNKKILFLKQARSEFLVLPGGHIEENELPHEAAIRETFEETGLKIKLLEKPDKKAKTLIVEPLPLPFCMRLLPCRDKKDIDILFTVKVIGGRLKINDESLEAKWLAKKQIKESKEVGPNLKYFALKILDTGVKHGE